MINYQFNADIKSMEEMISPIISALEEINANHQKVYQINLALEEILANIANYAYPSKEGKIYISYEINEDLNELKVIIKDNGEPFNPLEKEDPNLNLPVEKRKIGGLGIYIVKNMVNDIKYQRHNNQNVLEFVKKL